MKLPETCRDLSSALLAARDHVISRLSPSFSGNKGVTPDFPVCIVLGSGLGDFHKRVVDKRVEIPYGEVPNMPSTSVSGHAGKLILGELCGLNVCIYAGRVHGYEGYPPFVLSFQTRLAALLGAKVLIVTNAAGGSMSGMEPGCAMLLDGYLNMTRLGLAEAWAEAGGSLGDAFVAGDSSLDPRLAEIARLSSRDLGGQGIPLHEGTYALCPGPAYETPAEVIVGRLMGAGAFGMSSAPELMASTCLGVSAMCMSLVTNLASGMSGNELNHDEVKEVAAFAGAGFERLLVRILERVREEGTDSFGGRTQVPSDDPLPLPLVEKVGVPPTAEAASACARDLLSGAINSSGGFPALLAILPPGCAAAAIPGTAAASVPLKNIPGMPLVSPSVTGGGAVIGFYPSVAVVSGVTGRGLRECESAHIVALAAAAGCKCVLAAARGEAVGSGPTAGVHVDWSPVNLSFRTVTVADGSDGAEAEVNPLVTSGPEPSSQGKWKLAMAPGPDRPPHREISFLATLSNASKDGDALRIGAWTTDPVASVLCNAGVHGMRSCTAWVPAPKGTAIPDDAWTDCLKTIAAEASAWGPSVRAAVQPAQGATPAAVLRDPIVPLTQGDPATWPLAAKHITDALSIPSGEGSSLVAVVAESGLVDPSRVPNATVTGEIPYSDIPTFQKGSKGRAVALSFSGADGGDGKKKTIVLFDGVVSHIRPGAQPSDAAVTVRTAAAMGCGSLVILVRSTGGAGGDPSKPAISPVADHAVLTGRSPLTGENPASHGPRFPDMSAAHHPEIQSAMAEACAEISCEPVVCEPSFANPEVLGKVEEWSGAKAIKAKDGTVVLGVVDPPLSLHSASTLSLCGSLGLTAVSSAGGLEILAARHQGLRAGMAVVSATATGNKTEEFVSSVARRIF